MIGLIAEIKHGTCFRLIGLPLEAGLLVMPYTFHPENRCLAAGFRHGDNPDARSDQSTVAETLTCLDAGIDGFFTDDPRPGRQTADRR